MTSAALGVAEFFIAKRAAEKMIAHWERYKRIKKKAIEDKKTADA